MLGVLALDLHAADRIDRDLRLRGSAFRLAAAAARAGGRFRMIMACMVMSVVVFAMLMTALMMAGCRAVTLLVLRHLFHLAALETYTLGGYMNPMRKEIKASCLKRLKRIEGQIRGLAGMVEDDRYCIDVVTQIAAAKAALRRVEEEILRDHVAHCVEHAIVSGDKADQRRKIAELMDVIGRAER